MRRLTEVALKDFMYVSNKQGPTQGGVGVKTCPLSLIIHKNGFTCAKEINLFCMLVAC